MIKIGAHNFEWSSSRQSFVCRSGGDNCGMAVAAKEAQFNFNGTKVCCGNERFTYAGKDSFKCENCGVSKVVSVIAPFFTLDAIAKGEGAPMTAADYRKVMEQIEKQQSNIDVLYGSVGLNSEGEPNDKLSPNGIEFNCTKYNKVNIGGKDFMTIAVSVAKKAADEKRVIKYGMDESLAKYVTLACADLRTEIVKRAIEHAKIDIQSRADEAKKAILEMEAYLASARKMLAFPVEAAAVPTVTVAEKPKKSRGKAKAEEKAEVKAEEKAEVKAEIKAEAVA